MARASTSISGTANKLLDELDKHGIGASVEPGSVVEYRHNKMYPDEKPLTGMSDALHVTGDDDMAKLLVALRRLRKLEALNV